MNTERIEEIQRETAYPDSVSVQQALLKVWNECEQEKAVKNNAVLPLVSNRRELLLAFADFLRDEKNTQFIFTSWIDEFLSKQ